MHGTDFNKGYKFTAEETIIYENYFLETGFMEGGLLDVMLDSL
jgi:hypothetical protein